MVLRRSTIQIVSTISQYERMAVLLAGDAKRPAKSEERRYARSKRLHDMIQYASA